jgi:hypothetical protein
MSNPSTSSSSSSPAAAAQVSKKRKLSTDLVSRFNNAQAFPKTVHISELEINVPYKLFLLRLVKTKFGTSLCANISLDSTADDEDQISVFLPSRYNTLFQEDELSTVDYTRLHLVCEGKQGKTHIIKLVQNNPTTDK